MDALKYTIIKNEIQYSKYCDLLESLFEDATTNNDEIELLTLLIEKWDSEHSNILEMDPIEILKKIMTEHQLKAVDLVEILKLQKSTISKMLNYQVGISKDSIRILSEYFKVNQDLFNRTYPLRNAINRKYPNARLMNTRKELSV